MKKTILAILAVVALLLSGCGDSVDFVNEAQLAPSDTVPVDENQVLVQGVVVQRNPVFVVDKVEESPPGATPREGAIVRARDASGQLVGMALTAPDGSFDLNLQDVGASKLDVRVDIDSESADVEVELSAIPGENRPGLGVPVDRNQAISISQGEYDDRPLVLGTLTPLPVGTILSLDESERQLASAKWLFRIDPNPLLMFEHDVSYLLIDGRTGELERVESNSFPEVNGEAMWSEIEASFQLPSEGGSTLPVAGPEVVQVGQVISDSDQLFFSPANPVLPQAATAGGDEVFALLVVGNNSTRMESGASKLRQRLIAQGVPPSQIIIVSSLRPGRAALFSGVKTRAKVEGELKTALAILKAGIKARTSQGKSSTFLYYHVTHAVSTGQIQLANKRLVAKQFTRLGILDTGACKTRLLFEGCKILNFAAALAGQVRADSQLKTQDLVIYTSTDRKVEAALGLGGGYWTQLVAQQLTIVNGDVSGLATFGNAGPTVTGAAAQVENGRFFGTKQNPQVVVVNSNPAPCPPTAIPPVTTPQNIGQDRQAKFSIVNETNDQVELELEGESGGLEGTQKVTLTPQGTNNSRFEVVLPGGASGVQIKNFTPPTGQVRDLEGIWNIAPGSSQVFRWVDSDGGRTLIMRQE